MENPRKKFNMRAFAALMLAFSGLGLPITGVMNHIYGFSLLSNARHAWMSAHNVLGLLFVVFAIWHIVLNRQALWRHFAGAVSRFPAVSREALAAAAIVGIALFVFVGHALHIG